MAKPPKSFVGSPTAAASPVAGDDQVERTQKPGPKPKDTKPSDQLVGELRASLALKFPDARPDELAHQLLISRARMPKHVREVGKANMSAHIEITSATADWLQEMVLLLWPSRLPEA